LAAHLLVLHLLVGSQNLHDRLSTLLAIGYRGADLLNLLLLIRRQAELGDHLLHPLLTASVLALIARRVHGWGRRRRAGIGISGRCWSGCRGIDRRRRRWLHHGCRWRLRRRARDNRLGLRGSKVSSEGVDTTSAKNDDASDK